MNGSHRISGEAFAVERLRENPDLDYEAVRDAARAAGVDLLPIQYGRARRQLGLTGPAPARSSSGNVGNAAAPKPPAAEHDDEHDEEHEPVADAHADDDDGDHSDAPADSDDSTDDGDDAASGATDDAGEADSDEADEPATAPARRGSSAFDFLVQQLRREPTLSYGAGKTRAEPFGHKLAPIMYGRAKAMLGLVPVRPRGSGKNKKPAAAPAPAAAQPPRSLKQVESVAADRYSRQLAEVRSLEELVQAVKQLDAERRRLRALLEQIANTIDEALGYDD